MASSPATYGDCEHELVGVERVVSRELLAHGLPGRALLERERLRRGAHLDARVRVDDELLVRLLDGQVLDGIAEVVFADGVDGGLGIDDRSRSRSTSAADGGAARGAARGARPTRSPRS